MWGRRSRALSRLFFVVGALLLAKGSFSVLPFLLRSSQDSEVSIVLAGNGSPSDFEPGVPLFKLSLPRQRSEFVVVEGTSEADLRKGPGHLAGSPLPGADGNSVVAAHRDTHFRVLKNVLIGDEIRVDLSDRQLRYRVMDIRIVSPKDTSVLRPQAEDTLTLITCYPFYFLGPAPDRYVVQARIAKP